MHRFNLLLLVLLLLFSSVIHAEKKKPLQCFLSIEKAVEWNNFNLHLDMYSMSEQEPRKLIMSFDLPKTSATKPASNLIKQFDCQKHQRFLFTATFTPAIWRSADGKPIGNVSDSKGIFDISSQVINPPEKQSNLIITINFPKDFNLKEDPNVLIQKK